MATDKTSRSAARPFNEFLIIISPQDQVVTRAHEGAEVHGKDHSKAGVQTELKDREEAHIAARCCAGVAQLPQFGHGCGGRFAPVPPHRKFF